MSIYATCPDLGPRIHSLRPQSCPLVRGAHRGPGLLDCRTVRLEAPTGVSFRLESLSMPEKVLTRSPLDVLTVYGDVLFLCRVNLTCRPAARTSPPSRPPDAQPNPAGSVSVTVPKPPQPEAGPYVPVLGPGRPSNQPKR